MRRGARTSLAIATAATVCVVAVSPTGAQTGEPAGFIPGEATAAANTVVLGLSPGGGKPIDVSLGVSLARFQNRTATAEGAALKLGLLEIFFGPSSQCGERPPIIPAEQLPPVTTNDSRRNQPMAAPVDVRSPGDETGLGGVIGTQIANAAAEPQTSSAATTTISQDFGVLALDGGSTQVSTRLQGGVREAVAVTTGRQLRVLGGMAVINNPRWEAVARSGGTETSEGRFTFTSASLLGFERPVEQFGNDFTGFAEGLRNLLSGLGVFLEFPSVTVEEGRVTVSPLVLGLTNPPIGLDVIQPLLGAFAEEKKASDAEMIAEDCNNQARLQVLDLVLGVLSGSGAVTLSLGGASAFTAATEFPEPAPLDFGLQLDVASPLAVMPDQLTAPAPSFGTDFGVTTGIDLGVPEVAALPEVETVVPTTPKKAARTFELPSATLVSSRFEPGRRGGTPAIIGGAALALLLALAAADRWVIRRRPATASAPGTEMEVTP